LEIVKLGEDLKTETNREKVEPKQQMFAEEFSIMDMLEDVCYLCNTAVSEDLLLI